MSIQNIEKFVSEVRKTHALAGSKEHAFRRNLQEFFESYDEKINTINEPQQIENCAPDIAILKNKSIIGYVEAKAPNLQIENLSGNQKERYLQGLTNIVFTNCLDWEFYYKRELIGSVSIAELKSDKIISLNENFNKLNDLLRMFFTASPIKINTPDDLASWMASKTHLIRESIGKMLNDKEGALYNQFLEFQKHLIDNITLVDFADIYSQTITYGLFTARLHISNDGVFDRYRASELIPDSNPFLKNLFDSVVSGQREISWIINDMLEVLHECDLAEMLSRASSKYKDRYDAFLHFYEPFLNYYNKKKKIESGVFYTPTPVVKYIVRQLDFILRNEFDLPKGISDSEKIPITDDEGKTEKAHRVQILDPATGTGTFLTETVRTICEKIKEESPAIFSEEISKNHIPRVHGFEIMMAPYVICHLNLELLFQEFKYTPPTTTAPAQRLSIYLTNSLEGSHVIQKQGFGHLLTEEAKGAKKVKNKNPIMCIIGNPPYNRDGPLPKDADFKVKLDNYKMEPGGVEKLKERNHRELNDLYVQFMRLGQHYVEKNKSGVMAFITNRGYIDNLVFRGMRWQLLNAFDKIYILDLHGKKDNNVAEKDENVFDIKVGVAIIFAIKFNSGEETNQFKPAKVYLKDLIGSRESKFEELLDHEKLNLNDFKEIKPIEPHYFFSKFKPDERYESNSFSLDEFFEEHSAGFNSGRDEFLVDEDKEKLIERLKDLESLSDSELRRKYKGLKEDTKEWSINEAKSSMGRFDESVIKEVNYRPFEIYNTYFKSGVLMRPRVLSEQFTNHENFGLVFTKQVKSKEFAHIFVTEQPTEAGFFSGSSRFAPLYLYKSGHIFDDSKIPNIKHSIFEKISELTRDSEHDTPNEIDMFDYIYGVLHCPIYRKTFNEDLRKYYPRVPYPESPSQFWEISQKGAQLRKLHLLCPEELNKIDIQLKFQGEGHSIIEKVNFTKGKMHINEWQYFETVPKAATEVQIGSQKPAITWLQHRKGRKITQDLITDYTRIIKILFETDKIMKTINLKV